MRLTIPAALMFMFSPVAADEQRCTFIAGTASIIQDIRQEHGHDVDAISENVERMYRDDEGLENLKAIIGLTFHFFSKGEDPDRVKLLMMQRCIGGDRKNELDS